MGTLLAAALLVQATTFDIATFTVPAGWQRVDENGMVQLQTTRTVGRRTAYCQIFLFPSRPGSTNALRVAVITSTGKDPEVSMCFGEIVHDEWPPFFFSIRFKNWTPASQDRDMPRRIAGTWTTATASIADRYTFAPNGRYASAAAAMNRTRISQTEILQTTNAYFGDGAYAIQGNTITLTADGDRANPKRGWIRLEQDSKDGATWTDRLCLLLEGIGDVCYARDEGP